MAHFGELPDDVLWRVLWYVAGEHAKTAVEVVPLVCRRWRNVLRELCTDVTLGSRSRIDPRGSIGCSLAVAVARFRRVSEVDASLFSRLDLRDTPVLQSLSRLSLSGCTGVSDEGLGVIAAKCVHLTSLSLELCVAVSADGIGALAHGLHELEHLNLRSCGGVNDRALSAIAVGCPRIMHLDLSRCHGVSDSGLVALGSLRLPLRILSLRGCTLVSDIGIEALARGCRTLESLDMGNAHNNITQAALVSVGRWCPALEHLCLQDWLGALDIGLAAVGDGCPGFNRLILTFWRASSTQLLAGIRAVGATCKALAVVDLGYCDAVVGLKALARGCPGLKRLSLSMSTVGDDDLVAFAHNCRDLTHLDIPNGDITDAGLAVLGSACGNLLKLDIGGCGAVSDAGLAALCEGCRQLTQLRVACCPRLTDVGLIAIGSRLRGLLALDVCGCFGISASGVSEVAARCPRLATLTASRDMPWVTARGPGTFRGAHPGVRICEVDLDQLYVNRMAVRR